jgi:DNA-binding XRE family transcriptional regulator
MTKPTIAGKLVAELRNTTGKTQSQFAAMVGVSKDTIISVENGRNKLSPKLAKLIKAATGAIILDDHIEFEPVYDIPHLESMPTLSEEQRTFMRREHDGTGNREHVYTREDFEKWRTTYYQCNDELARKHYDNIKKWIEVIFRAAAIPGLAGNRNRFPAVYQSFVDWLNETRSTFKLENEIEHLLEDEPHQLGEMTLFGPMDNNPTAMKMLTDSGFDYSKVKTLLENCQPSQCIVLELETRPGWDPFRCIKHVPCTTRKLAPKPKCTIEDRDAVFERNMKKYPHIFKTDEDLTATNQVG